MTLFRGKDPGDAEIIGQYVSVTRRIALEMVEAGEAEQVKVVSTDNGAYLAYVETELGVRNRANRQRQLRDVSCSMGPRVTEMAAQGVAKYCILVAAWSNGRCSGATQ